MKKVLTLMLALVMAFCLAVPAFAEGSVVEGATAVAPNGVELTVGASSQTIPDAKKALADAGVTAAGTASVVYLHDLSVPAGTTFPIDITFTLGSADGNDKLYVLHWNGSKWEKVGEGTGKTVVGHFTSLSPVAVILEQVAGTGETGTNGGAPTAPQTGDSMAVPFFGLAVIALAGIVAYKARKKEM